MSDAGPPPAQRFTVEQAAGVLRDRFGHRDFRAGQPEALQSIARGRSLLVVMPTGSGKSLLYQLPALLEDGLTLVVSPLIALMKDQVDDLARRGIPATFINSSLGLDEQHKRMARCVAGQARILYVAPERFRSGAFLDMLRRLRVARMAVDEAHCISEWGHDFRPDYRRLKQFREEMGRPLVTALTATATPRVQQDILSSLGLAEGEADVHVHGFDRPNLALAVEDAPNENAKNEFVLEFLRGERGPGIVYVGTRKMAEDLAAVIRTVEPTTTFYHAGMEPEERTRAQEKFLQGRARVAVATLAFGMGIDKCDIRFVLHYHYPGSVEQYYQEIGRAGRDDLPSRCILLYAPADHFLREFFIDLNYPAPEQVQSVYEALWSIPENPVLMTYKEIAGLCREDNVKEGQVGAAVRLLDAAGVTQALAGEATARIGLDRPGAEILPGIRGEMQRRVFEALASAADLETPGDFRIEPGRLARVANLTDEQTRRALAALAEAGHIDYEPPFRGRGVRKMADPPPPFEKVPIDWEREEFLRGLEEEKLEAIENYIHTQGCRRRFILQYFGEKSDLHCGTCDRCAAKQGRKAAKPPAPGDILSRQPAIAAATLVCVRHLRFPLGISRTAQVLTGSRDKDIIDWRLDRNPAYGTVRARQDVVKQVIEAMLRDGYLKREGDRTRPVLGLTKRGEKAADEADREPPAPPRPAGRREDKEPAAASPSAWRGGSPAPPRGEHAPPPPCAAGPETRRAKAHEAAPAHAAPSPAADMERYIRRMLVADRDEAQALVDHLRLYHPGAMAARLEAAFNASDDVRVRSRAVWAAGELGGENALAFLVRCAQSETVNVRRLAASALGKVAASARLAGIARQEAIVAARQVLTTLAADAAPQVAQYARKSLTQFPAADGPEEA
ncbi:MAG: RecQ family ATP-dependent DNA helicase [Planctomycetota bacterium]|nr:RecQ family ATP-dependent DNA helicase [Planctomycetota bacterium]